MRLIILLVILSLFGDNIYSHSGHNSEELHVGSSHLGPAGSQLDGSTLPGEIERIAEGPIYETFGERTEAGTRKNSQVDNLIQELQERFSSNRETTDQRYLRSIFNRNTHIARNGIAGWVQPETICFKGDGYEWARFNDLGNWLEETPIDQRWRIPSMVYKNQNGDITGIGYFHTVDPDHPHTPPPLPTICEEVEGGCQWFIHMAGLHPFSDGGFIPMPSPPGDSGNDRQSRSRLTGVPTLSGIWHPQMWDLHIWFPLPGEPNRQPRAAISRKNAFPETELTAICPENDDPNYPGNFDASEFFCPPEFDDEIDSRTYDNLIFKIYTTRNPVQSKKPLLNICSNQSHSCENAIIKNHYEISVNGTVRVSDIKNFVISASAGERYCVEKLEIFNRERRLYSLNIGRGRDCLITQAKTLSFEHDEIIDMLMGPCHPGVAQGGVVPRDPVGSHLSERFMSLRISDNERNSPESLQGPEGVFPAKRGISQ